MAPDDQVRRGYRHWLIIGVGAVVLIAVYLLNR